MQNGQRRGLRRHEFAALEGHILRRIIISSINGIEISGQLIIFFIEINYWKKNSY
jgi:hypothetical protein